MRYIPKQNNDPNLLVGIDHSDDGGVYKLTDDLALIQTVDFFTPIVDNPYKFGQIAAANALSDVYAMGGKPITVLNIVAYPIKTLGPELLAEILRGSSDKVREAGAQIIGGHSIDDNEPKFGLSVTGTVHPKEFYTNNGAQPGDVLILTKPIGVGIQTTAIKRDLLKEDQIVEVTNVMSMLNKYAAEGLKDFQANAVTDITGFGLLGHAYEMASGSDLSFVIYHSDVPILSGTKALAEKNIIPGGSKANHKWLTDKISFSKHIKNIEQMILTDAVTSGGLLISLPEKEAQPYLNHLKQNTTVEAAIIGEVIEKKEKALYVE